MKYLRQSTAVTISFGPAVALDGFTPVTNLVGTGAGKFESTTSGIALSKNGGIKAVRHATATASVYDADGYYQVTLDATDTNTAGRMRASFPGSASLAPIWDDFMVVAANVYDALFAPSGTDLLKVDIAAINDVAADAALLAAMVECGLTGTVSSTGADATHLQFTDITEVTAKHYLGKEGFILNGTLIKQRLGVVTDYAISGGQGRFTFSKGSPSNETAAAGTICYFA